MGFIRLSVFYTSVDETQAPNNPILPIYVSQILFFLGSYMNIENWLKDFSFVTTIKNKYPFEYNSILNLKGFFFHIKIMFLLFELDFGFELQSIV